MIKNAIEHNIAKLDIRIRLAAEKNRRHRSTICTLAVSKTRTAAEIRAAFDAGLDQVGENYLHEALEKMTALADLPLSWHFIGPVQSNKTRLIAENFGWVHSVDRLKIARRLSDQRPAQLPPLQLCLQVNVSREESKSGVALADLPALAAAVDELPNITLRGLMTIPRASDDYLEQRAAFALLGKALRDLRQQMPQLDTLSMGMSRDLEAAIAEGATIIRVGTDIFGPRT